MYVKIHKSCNNFVVAVCDEELIGKSFHKGKLCLNITERFYKGDEKSCEEIKEILKDAPNVNFVGEESIKLGISLGLIKKESIIKIQGVPHAQSALL